MYFLYSISKIFSWESSKNLITIGGWNVIFLRASGNVHCNVHTSDSPIASKSRHADNTTTHHVCHDSEKNLVSHEFNTRRFHFIFMTNHFFHWPLHYVWPMKWIILVVIVFCRGKGLGFGVFLSWSTASLTNFNALGSKPNFHGAD